MSNTTERFSNRVENYIKYRPSYPPQVIDLLRDECGLASDSLIADVGSGTGIFARLLLENGCQVFGIEPNEPMREAAEKLLADYPKFTSIAAPAEATPLPDDSVDLITAAQAFHWFDRDKAKLEFRRILKPGGYLVLIWNERLTDTTLFLREYEKLLLDYSTDYTQVNHTQIDDTVLSEFFAPSSYQIRTFENRQLFDYEGLQGRLLSSSYAPPQDHPSAASMLAELRRIFDANQQKGTVSFDYETKVYFGVL